MNTFNNSQHRKKKIVRDSQQQQQHQHMNIHQQSVAAQKAAMYYGECYFHGVGSEDASYAATKIKKDYNKWWLQQFDKQRNSNDEVVDSPNATVYKGKNSPPENTTSSLIEEEAVRSNENRAIESVADDSENSRLSSHQRQTSSLPNGQYFSVSDVDFHQIGGDANAAAAVLVEGGDRKTGRKTSMDSVFNSCSPPRYAHLPNEKKRQYRDFNQYSNVALHQPNPREDKSDGNESSSSSKQSKKGSHATKDSNQKDYEQDLHYQKASSFGKYMDVADQVAPKVYNTNNNHNNIDRDSVYPSSRSNDTKLDQNNNFSFHSLDEKLNSILTSRSSLHVRRAKHRDNAKLTLVHALAVSGGDVTSKEFLFALDQLRTLFMGVDARESHSSMPTTNESIEGTWLCLSRPHFKDCLGENSAGEYMYTMGRMSFDMFAPTDLVCSIQCVFNTIERVDVSDISKVLSIPRDLRAEVHSGKSILRTYKRYISSPYRVHQSIVTAFTIEPDSPTFGNYSPNKFVHKALQGLFTVQGYILPDPEKPNRLSIWFSGGEMVGNENNEKDLQDWRKIFEEGTCKRHLYEKARLLAAKILLGAEIPEGMNADGSMRFKLNRPIGGHGTAYVDVLYLDETLRIVRGHHGSLFVFTRAASS